MARWQDLRFALQSCIGSCGKSGIKSDTRKKGLVSRFVADPKLSLLSNLGAD
jgi:hypothetical protein